MSACVGVLGAADPHTVLPRATVDEIDALLATAVTSTSSDSFADATEVVAVDMDVIPAAHVSFIVTNTGTFTPAQCAGAAAELYG